MCRRSFWAVFLVSSCLLFSFSGLAHADYHGIWKDNATGNTHNFYIQSYSTGSMVVIYTLDAVNFYAFLGDLSGTTFEQDSMDPLHALSLSIDFSSSTEATALITDNTLTFPVSTQVAINKVFPAVRTQHSGIWKNTAAGLNLYIQDYTTGSTVIVYTYDGEHFQAFLSNMTGTTFDCHNMADGSEFMQCEFTDTGTADITMGPEMSSGVRNLSASFSGEVVKLFHPDPLDIDFEADPISGEAPLEVEFTDLSSVDRPSVLWSFGDGITSTDSDPTHTYDTPGSYTVSLFCSDGTAETTTMKSDYVLVTGPDYVTVSGYVTTAVGVGLDLVQVAFSGIGGVLTDSSGYYAMLVPSGWSGTVAPSRSGYTFSPTSHSFSGVTANLTHQDFTGTPETIPASPIISGTVNVGGLPLAGVVVTFSGLGSTVTNSLGVYGVMVPSGWSGTVTPSSAGYTFTPASRSYVAAASDQTNQDYTASAASASVTVSGRVSWAGSGISDVTMTFSNGGGSTVTDADGYYTHTVDYGWSGTLTPSKTGMVFDPTSRSYTGITSDQTDQDYYLISLPRSISGRVSWGGSGISGVTMSFSNGGGSTVTDSGGYYSHTLDYGWSGTVTPSKTGMVFDPTSRSYTGITSDQTDQDYYLISLPRSISGRVSWGGSGISGVTMSFSNGGGSTVTDSGGYYSHTLDYGWSGTVTPSKTGMVFDPTSRSYTGITSDQTNQDYYLISLPRSISGRVSWGGSGISGVTMSFSNGGGSTVTDSGGYYSHTVDYGWSGTVTPSKTGMVFDPTSRSYTGITSDQTNQDYYLISLPRSISGRVSWGGSGISGVTMSFSNGGGSTVTDSDGYYSHTVDYGWSGTVTPSKTGMVFDPTSRSYTGITSDQTNQDYILIGLES